MHHNNFTMVTEIHLLGFKSLPSIKAALFSLLLIIYCVTLCGNLLIIVLVPNSRNLHSPMYFFLTQLSISDIMLSTDIVPNMLNVVLYEGYTMSFTGCLIQFYLFAATETLECILLTVMSYDRYQAICNPLHYTSVMDFTFCLRSVVLFWFITFGIIMTFAITMSQFQFCGPNVIDHFFCDLYPILELSCTDTYIVQLESMLLAIPIIICPYIIIIMSYVYIISTILRIPSTTGRQKTFSTCSSHLAVVFIYYGSLLSIYLFPNNEHAKKSLSLMYTVLTPLLNPLIYSLRNKYIRKALEKIMDKVQQSCC